MRNNENKKICKICAENFPMDCCCKTLPGSFIPKDIKPLNAKIITNKLFLNEWAVDYWEGDPLLYYLRPATVSCKRYIDPSWGGECFYLSENGCQLNFENRPTQCKALIPKAKGPCRLNKKFNKYHIALLWHPYEDLLIKAVDMAIVRNKAKG